MTNSSPSFQMPLPTLSGSMPQKIVLSIPFVPPSLKNSKMIVAKTPRGKPLQRPLLITRPECQKVMAEITESFRLQLLSECQTFAGGMATGYSLRSMIAYSTPGDDSLNQIPEMHIRTERVEPGKEGIEVIIERIS